MAGIERLSRVDVEVFGGLTVIVPWGLRDWLLDQLEPVDGTETIRATFLAVGSSRPVQLGERDRVWLGGFLDGLDRAGTLPVELRHLRDGLRPFRIISGDDVLT